MHHRDGLNGLPFETAGHSFDHLHHVLPLLRHIEQLPIWFGVAPYLLERSPDISLSDRCILNLFDRRAPTVLGPHGAGRMPPAMNDGKTLFAGDPCVHKSSVFACVWSGIPVGYLRQSNYWLRPTPSAHPSWASSAQWVTKTSPGRRRR